MILEGYVSKRDSETLSIFINGCEYRADIGDIKMVISEGQKKAQIREGRQICKTQTVLGVC